MTVLHEMQAVCAAVESGGRRERLRRLQQAGQRRRVEPGGWARPRWQTWHTVSCQGGAAVGIASTATTRDA